MNILFMCVANSARSQLAEGLAQKLFKGSNIQSAGSKPGVLNPYAVSSLKEVGIDISTHFSKSIDDLSTDFLDSLDYVITLCAEEVCPHLVSKAKRLHWPIEDPATKLPLSAEEHLNRFRVARDLIQTKLTHFLNTLK